MAITSYGYPGAIVPGAVWAEMQQLLGRAHVVPGKSDWEPSAYGASARTVRLAPGTIGGDGILDKSDAPIDVQLPTVGSGTQYFLVGANRVWGATNKTTPGYVAGTSARALPAFTDNPGVQAFQPTALARVSAGDPTITDLVDLRAIAQEPGVYTIFDDLALQLIARPGVLAYNAVTGITRRRVYVGTSWTWQRVYDPLTGIPPFMMIGRDEQFGTDLGSVNTWFYAGQPEVTSTQGAWQENFKGYLGGANFQQAAAGNIAQIEILKGGTYAIGARYSIASTAPIRAALALNVAGLGYRRYGPVQNETAQNLAGTWLELSLTDTMYMPAGAKFQPKWSTYGTTRLRYWYMWITKISAE